jgi:hypothetical protein
MTLDSNSPNQSITKGSEMPNHRLVTLLSAGAIATSAGLAVPSPARAQDDQEFTIESRLDVATGPPGLHLCLQPVDQSTERGAAIVQLACADDKGGRIRAQRWTRKRVSGNIFHFINSLSQLCLDVRGVAADGTPVQQWPCNEISNEKWETGKQTDPGTPPPLISRVSGTRSHCLDMPGADPTEGRGMQIWRCNGTVAQQWNQRPVFPEG